MCTKRWDEINFSRIASICLSKNNRVFLGEDRIGNIKYQDDPIRMKCRQNLLDQISSGLNGKQLAPNEMVEKVYHECVSAGIAAVMNSQWESLVKNVRDQIEKRVQENGSTNFDISRCVVMSDVSGSMAGTPMMVSVGFGILVSELTHPAFRDIVLTFDEDPVFYSLRACINFTGKVKALMRAPWGGSTNFEGAMNLIASVIEQNKLSEDEIPKSLLVVSDMQFNDAIGNSNYTKYHLRKWGTAFDNIKNMFTNLGQRLYQKPIDPPQIIFWNVRANTPGFPAAANESGVTLMSGYSPALLKFIFSGDLEQEVEIADENGEVKKVKVKQTPKETLAKILGEKALDPVREIVNKYF